MEPCKVPMVDLISFVLGGITVVWASPSPSTFKANIGAVINTYHIFLFWGGPYYKYSATGPKTLF